MSFVALLALCFFQPVIAGTAPPAHMEDEFLAWQMIGTAKAAPDQAATREAVYEEQQFVEKFNKLLNTLQEFAEQYNHHVINVKKVRALKKAWNDLEKTDKWFRLGEHSSR